MSELSAIWRAGAASLKITPSEPLWLAGWAARIEPAKGTLSDLFAKALLLEDSAGQRLMLVCVDVIALPRALCDRIVKLADVPVPRENFIFAASHTHCAPEIRPDKVRFFNIPEPFASKIPAAAETLAHQVASTIRSAMQAPEPVTLHAHRTTAAFAHNRRAASDTVDHEVPVLELRRPDRSKLAIVFGYACHNLTLPPDDCRYSADFSGAACASIEDEFPRCTAMFITGCAADQNPHPRGSIELVDAHGQALANAVLQTFSAESGPISSNLHIATAELELEMQVVTRAWIDQALASSDTPLRNKAQYLNERLNRGDVLERTISTPVQVIKLGQEVLMILLGGEPVAEWALRFRQSFHAPLVWVAGYSNDMCGYLPTRRVMQEGGYEAGRANLWSALPSFWTDNVEDRVQAIVQHLAQQVNSQ